MDWARRDPYLTQMARQCGVFEQLPPSAGHAPPPEYAPSAEQAPRAHVHRAKDARGKGCGMVLLAWSCLAVVVVLTPYWAEWLRIKLGVLR